MSEHERQQQVHETKWFDLEPHGLALSRLQDRPGIHVLELTGTDLPMDLSVGHTDGGWIVGEGEARLVNHRVITGLRDVADTLRPFLSDDDIEGSLCSAKDLRQGEKLDGVARPVEVDVEVIRGHVELVDESNQHRIIAGVEAAREANARRRERVVEKPALNGSSLRIMKDLAAAQRSRSIVGSDVDLFGAMRSLVRLMMAAHRELKDSLRQRAQDALVAFDEGDDGPVEDIIIEYGEEFSRSHVPGQLERIDAAQKYADMVGSKHSALEFHLDALCRRLTSPELDGLLELPPGLSAEEALKGIRFRADPGLPTYMLNDAAVRVSRSLDTMSRVLGVSQDSLIPTNMTLVIASKAAMKGNVSGSARSGNSNSTVVRISHSTPGAFVHEVGHAVHFSNGWEPDTIAALLQEVGLWDPIEDAVLQAKADGYIGDQYSQYLLHPYEMFARSFDAAMQNEVVAEGDVNFDSLGGGLGTVGGRFDFSPVGNPEMSRKLVDELRERLAVSAESQPLHATTIVAEGP